MKNRILLMAVIAFSLLSAACEKQGEKKEGDIEVKGTYTYTVASRRAWSIDGESGFVFPMYYVKKGSEDWKTIQVIDGFSYEPGYEYTIKAKLYVETVSDHSVLVDVTKLELLDVISKVEKSTEGLPEMSFYYEDYLGDPSLLDKLISGN